MHKKPKLEISDKSISKKITDNRHYIFLLIGKTGTGRSATGNSILGENYFVSSDTDSRTTRDISTKTTLRDQIKVTVIDTPGIMDNSVSSDEAKTKACTDLTTAMTECPKDGKIIIVLVLKYGERFTEENRQTMYILENILGDSNMWTSCIIIMTHGDVFNINNEAGLTFEGWTESKKDGFGKMFRDSSYRCLLYNNRTKNQEERKEQFEKLIKFSDQIDRGYTMTTFLEAKRHRNRLILEEKLTEIKKTCDNTIKDLIYAANTLSDRGDAYTAITNSIAKVRDTLDIHDNHGLIYYGEGELSIFNEQRVDLNYLEEYIEMRFTLSDLKKEIRALENIDTKLTSQRINELEYSIDSLDKKIVSKVEFQKYRGKIAILQERLKSKRQEIKRQETRECYELKIKNISEEVNALLASVDFYFLIHYFEQVDRLHVELVALEEELGNLHCFPKTNELKEEILSRIEVSTRRNTVKFMLTLLAVVIVIRIIFYMIEISLFQF